MNIKKGSTRLVFVFNKFVIKIPNFLNGYKLILLGLIGNLNEKEWSGYSEKLCPVMFCSPFGIFQIMKKAEPITDMNFYPSEDYFDGLPSDNNNINLGYIKNRLVLIDYGSVINMLCPKCKRL